MISHKHKVIFIHIPKCAGSSIVQAFLDDLGLSFKARLPLCLGKNETPEIGPPVLGHMTLTEYVDNHYLSEYLFNTYFKFTFVRNPWHRVVSMYKYLHFDETHHFKDFVMSCLVQDVWKNRYWWARPQIEYITDHAGIVRTNFIGRYENLKYDWDYLAEMFHMKHSLKYVNKSENKSPYSFPAYDSYPEYYDDESQAYIGRLYEVDCRAFGYESPER